jgi:hypothetical protein
MPREPPVTSAVLPVSFAIRRFSFPSAAQASVRPNEPET